MRVGVNTALATTLGKDGVKVGTVEHLLAALTGLGVDNVRIELDGPEVPIIDGSALPFMHLIDASGVKPLGVTIPVLRITEPIEIVEGEKSIRIVPSNRLVIKYKIDLRTAAYIVAITRVATVTKMRGMYA